MDKPCRNRKGIQRRNGLAWLAAFGSPLLIVACSADFKHSAPTESPSPAARSVASPKQAEPGLKGIPADLCSRLAAVQSSSMLVSGKPTEVGDGISEKTCLWMSGTGGTLTSLTVTVSRYADLPAAREAYERNRSAADGRFGGAAPTTDLQLEGPVEKAYLQAFRIPSLGAAPEGVAALGALLANLVYKISIQAPGSDDARLKAIRTAFSLAQVP